MSGTGPAVHPTTVYRTLETLTAVGLTHAVHGLGPTRYCVRGTRTTTSSVRNAARWRPSPRSA